MDSLRRHIGSPSAFALAARAALADADAIIVMLGTNDAMWGTERFREHFVHEMKALNRQLFALRAGSARGSPPNVANQIKSRQMLQRKIDAVHAMPMPCPCHTHV